MKKFNLLKLCLGLFFLSTTISCPGPDQPGSEFPVNYIKYRNNEKNEQVISKSTYINFSTINSSLETPAIATNRNGISIIAWVDNSKGTKDIYARRYDGSGNPLGEILEVNTSANNDQNLPAVAINESGSFIIVWTSKSQDGDGYGVYARRYDQNGRYTGPEFKINTSTSGNQWIPSVVLNNNGAFIVTWESAGQDGNGYAVIAQKFDNTGIPAGPEIIVNNTPKGSQEFPRIAMDTNGNFIIVWNSNQNQQTGDINSAKYSDIYAKKFNRNGNPEGPEFIVSTNVGEQWLPSVAINDNNNFVITWNSREANTESFDIYARNYVSGIPAQTAFKVNNGNRPDQLSHPAVAINNTGNFIIAWNSATGILTSSGVFAKKYNASGQEQGPEFKINGSGANVLQPDISMDRTGNYTATWREY
jgi:hypothetical protein